MERVGAGFHRVVEISAGRLSVFRSEVAGLNGDFLNGFHATLAVLLCNFPDVAGRVLSFNADVFAIGGKAVHHDRQCRSGNAVPGRRMISCRGSRMLPKAPPPPLVVRTGKWLTSSVVIVWLISPLSVFSRGASSVTVIVSVVAPKLKRHVQSEYRCGHDFQVRADIFLEARRGYREFVLADRYGDDIVSGA